MAALASTVGIAAAQGAITIETSVDGNTVTVDVTIVDNGGAPGCQGFT